MTLGFRRLPPQRDSEPHQALVSNILEKCTRRKRCNYRGSRENPADRGREIAGSQTSPCRT